MRRGKPVKPRQAGYSHPESGPESQQPGPPQQEARLLAVDQVAETLTVRLDDGRQFEVGPRSLPAGLPALGEAVPLPVLEELQAAASRKLAARDLLTILGRRLLPMARLRRSLMDRGHDPGAVDGVLGEMEAKGLCSDRLYAEAYCRDCLLTRAVGPRYLVARLQEKQVPRQVAQAVADEAMTLREEAELACRASRGRWARMRGPADVRAVAKVVRFLLSRGFSPQVAGNAARTEQPGSSDGAAATEE